MAPAGDSAQDLSGTPYTFVFKRVDDAVLSLDLYPPLLSLHTVTEFKPDAQEFVPDVPAVVYFHGGGLTVGDRKSWLPVWLRDRVTNRGMLFISAEYRLIPPSTGHDMLADVKDLFHFLQHHINGLLRAERARVLGQYDLERRYYRPNFQVNPNCIAVAGSSAGGLCAYLAATHASPRPKAVLSLYGMGGDFMTSHYLSPKTEVFFRGRELLDASQFSEYLYPQCLTLKATADSALTYHSGDSPTPGLPSNPRMYLARLYLQKGVYLDYYTGCHDPSISKTLRHLHSGEDGSESTSCSHILIPAEHLPLFPQYAVSADWPPTFLIHGTSDTAVHVHESLCMESALQSAGVRVALRAIEDEEHSFDYAPGAEEQFGQAGGLFDEAVDFLLHQMQSPAH